MTWLARSHPERDVEAVGQRRPEQRERVVHDAREPEHCGHCEGWHDPQILCPEARWDAEVEAAYNLIATLREHGVSLKLVSDRIQVHGGAVDDETLAVLKGLKPVLVAILRSEG